MDLMEIIEQVLNYATNMKVWEFLGFVLGVLCVLFLIRQNILTWPMGIAYVLISLVIFWQTKLYADFVLHLFYFGMNVYGWYYWVYGRKSDEQVVPVTSISVNTWLFTLGISAVGIFIWGYLLNNYTDASLAYWDSTTSVLSFAAMWLTARKKIENWILWLVVDILATGIYYYKGLYFYCLLYLVYIGMAIAGYLAWKKSMNRSLVSA